MKNILKFLLIIITLQVSLNSCNGDEAYPATKSADPSFKLYDPSIASNVLYSSMTTNPFTLVWDESLNSQGTYTVVFSKDADFKTPITLGTTTKSFYSTTIGALNTALLQAGLTPYKSTPVYFKVLAGSSSSSVTSFNSNIITFGVTTFPVSKPVLTSPASGSAIVLVKDTPAAVASIVNWTDIEYGSDVVYTVQVAKSGTMFAMPINAGTVTNLKTLSWTTRDLNTVALDAGLPKSGTGMLDIRVKASTTSKGGTIDILSEPITISVTTYTPTLPKFFIVGGATVPGWSAGSSVVMYQDPINNAVISVYTKISAGQSFRFLGQQDWNPINYSINAAATRESYKFFTTVSSNVIADGDENMKFTGTTGYHKVEIDYFNKGLKITPVSNVFKDDYPELYIAGSMQGWNPANGIVVPQDIFGEVGVYETDIVIPNGTEFKILGQKSWGDIEYGNIGNNNHGNDGFLGYKGDNGNIKLDGGGAMHNIRINIQLGTIKITKL